MRRWHHLWVLGAVGCTTAEAPPEALPLDLPARCAAAAWVGPNPEDLAYSREQCEAHGGECSTDGVRISRAVVECLRETRPTESDWWTGSTWFLWNAGEGYHWYTEFQGFGGCLASPDYCSQYRLLIDPHTGAVLSEEVGPE